MAKFNDVVIDGNSDPLSYNEATREFTADSDDVTLITQILPFSVEAEFTEYPLVDNLTVSTAVATADVEFDNPCLDPFTFETIGQNNPASDEYTGTNIVFTLTKFTIDPPRCKINYACTSVEKIGGANSDISCDEL